MVFALGLGILGSITIWALTPYNNFYLSLGFISDTYLPILALFIFILITLFLNPCLRKLSPSLAFSRIHLAIILSMLLMASVIPGQGLMRFLPYLLARFPAVASWDVKNKDIYTKIETEEALFPAEIGYGIRVDAASFFQGELPVGGTIPWEAWLAPFCLWGIFFIFSWLAMLSLSAIVFRQWKDNERLPFPLVNVFETFVSEPDQGYLLPPIFRNPFFWLGAGTVFAIYLLNGFSAYFPNRVPTFPLKWDISKVFVGTDLQAVSSHLKRSQIYFVFIGIAFIMPTRIGFSIWFFMIGYGFYQMLKVNYFPPYHGGAVAEHRMGASLALVFVILWLGRLQWLKIAQSLFRSARSDEELSNKVFALVLLFGSIGFTTWLVFAGVSFGWAIVFLMAFLMTCLLIGRIVAETGMPFMSAQGIEPAAFLSLFPASWLSHTTLFFSRFCSFIFNTGSRMSPVVMATHAFTLTQYRKFKSLFRFSALLLGVLCLGFVISGAVHLHMNYHHSTNHEGTTRPLNSWGVYRFNTVRNDLVKLENDTYTASKPYNREANILFGFSFAAALQWACLQFPKWPLHPIGLVLVNTWYLNIAWFSIFLGWLFKIIILRYGGSRFYERMLPLFLGLIIGEVFASILWSIVPAYFAIQDLPYETFIIQPT